MKSVLDRDVDSVLLRDSLNEISEHFGSTTRNPISVSLLCIDLGITEDERDALMIAFRQLLNNNLDEMTEAQVIYLFRASVISILGIADDVLSVDVIIGLITGFSKGYIPELYGTAMFLQAYHLT